MKNFIAIGATEDEQEQKIKDWIKNNILFIILGIAVGLGGVFGWNYYKNYKYEKNINARISYLNFINSDNTNEVVENLTTNKEYNNQILMVSAKNNLKNPQLAIENLNKINSESFIDDIKNIKLAQILLEQKKYEKAISTLENNSLLSTQLHLLGDIYQAQNKLALAKETYEEALKNSSNNQIRSILNIKINSLK